MDNEPGAIWEMEDYFANADDRSKDDPDQPGVMLDQSKILVPHQMSVSIGTVVDVHDGIPEGTFTGSFIAFNVCSLEDLREGIKSNSQMVVLMMDRGQLRDLREATAEALNFLMEND